MSGKGSAPRPYSVDKETFDQSFERIFGKREPRIGTQERDDWQEKKNRIARELLDLVPLRGVFPDQTHCCKRCGKASMPGHIHTCSPQIKENSDVPDSGRT